MYCIVYPPQFGVIILSNYFSQEKQAENIERVARPDTVAGANPFGVFEEARRPGNNST